MEYIKLAHANVTQNTIGAKRTDWVIKANKTHEELGTLPSSLTDKEVFALTELVPLVSQFAGPHLPWQVDETMPYL